MAQRVFLVPFVPAELDRAADAIAGTPGDRRDLAADLARAASLHVRRVAASERVAAASASDDEDWDFARSCPPYLLAARDAKGMLEALARVAELETDDAIEAFFVEQAKAAGATVGPLDRAGFAAPATDALAAWIAEHLEKASRLRAKAFADFTDEAMGDYAVSTWIWLGQIFARTQPSFWQGRNRWLGGAAFPDAFQVGTSVMTIAAEPTTLWGRVKGWFGGGEPDVDPELARMIAASQEHTKAQLAKASIRRLRGLLVSASTLTSKLAIGKWTDAKWEEALPKEGGGNLVSGAVPRDRLDDLVAALLAVQAEGDLPYETGDEWIELVVAAATWAKGAGAHLVEGDDVLWGGYRWPVVDEPDAD